nr:iron-containing alcohol dehydrogenase [uncultured Desulfobacter sp.]
MQDFNYHNPTKVYFGKTALDNLVHELETQDVSNVLFVYGGGSIKANGVYDTVMKALKQCRINIVEHAGVKGNPSLNHARNGITKAKDNNVDLILAAGGGSVMDEAKAVAAGALVPFDVWDFYCKKETVSESISLFAIPTLPATSSEMNGISVLCNDETNEKFNINAQGVLNPVAAFLDPQTTYTLSLKQTAYACTDIISHLTESYFTTSSDKLPLQGRIIEGLVKTVMDAMDVIMKKPNDYDARASFMWTATLAWSGIVQVGIPDWGMPCHALEMSMSGYHDTAHGVGLSVLTPSWMKHAATIHPIRILTFGRNILGIHTDNIDDVIEGLKKFYRSIGAPTTFLEAGIENPEIEIMTDLADKVFKSRGIPGYSRDEIRRIYKNCC